MTPELHERDTLDLWWRAGALPAWVSCAIAAACAITLGVAAVGARTLWEHAGAHSGLDPFWFSNGLALGLAAWIAASLVPRWHLSRWLRVGILLPPAQLLAMLVAWCVWEWMAPELPVVAYTSPLVASVPLPVAVVVAAVVCAAAGRLIAGPRRREWLHGAVMMALVNLLLVGQWVPIVSWFWCRKDSADWWGELDGAFAAPAPLLALALGPPLLAALAFTAGAFRAPEVLQRWRGRLGLALGVLFAGAMIARFYPSMAARRVFGNFIHIELAMGIVASVALCALGAATCVRAARARRALAGDPLRRTGRVVGDDRPVVGSVEIASWLRGPRFALRSCAVETAGGDVLVPGGAELVARIPAITTRLRAGDSIEVLRAGDPVVLAGYVAPPAGHPFRDGAALAPGPRGVLVGRAGDAGTSFSDTALGLWRPCVAYLLILAAVALPAMVTAFTARGV